MTTLYVSSVDGSNSDNGTTWALAKQTVAGALSALTGTGPHIVYVDSAHAFTSSAAEINWNAAVANQKVSIISVDRNGSTTTGHNGWLAGATETSADTYAFRIGGTNNGNYWVWGMNIVSGSSNTLSGNNFIKIGNSTSASHNIAFVKCNLRCPALNANARFDVGQATGANANATTLVLCVECDFQSKYSASGAAFIFNTGYLTLVKCTHSYTNAAAKCANLFTFASTGVGSVTVIDSDLSGFDTSGGNIVDVSNMRQWKCVFANCKLSSTPGLLTGTWPTFHSSITVVNSDSADTANAFEFRDKAGTLVEDAATYRNNGARYDTAGVAWKIDTTADCDENTPFVTPWIARVVSRTGSVDLTIDILRDSATDFTNRQVWAEFETLEDASFPVGTLTSSRNANPFDGSGSDLTNSTDASWTESLTNDNEMLITTTRTLAEKSLLRARVGVGVASTTLYIDPMLQVSGQPNNCPTRWTVEGAVNAEPVAPKANYIAGL